MCAPPFASIVATRLGSEHQREAVTWRGTFNVWRAPRLAERSPLPLVTPRGTGGLRRVTVLVVPEQASGRPVNPDTGGGATPKPPRSGTPRLGHQRTRSSLRTHLLPDTLDDRVGVVGGDLGCAARPNDRRWAVGLCHTPAPASRPLRFHFGVGDHAPILELVRVEQVALPLSPTSALCRRRLKNRCGRRTSGSRGRHSHRASRKANRESGAR